MRPEIKTLALVASVIVVLWSVLFLPTYRYSFFWDDYHCIRPYSAQELLSTFHGWDDPDKVETPALRPIVALLFAFQGTAFGENVILHRIFLTVLTWIFLLTVGLLLAELGFKTLQIALVFGLFVFSRAFVTINLWIIQSSLLLSYVLIVLALFLFIRWVKHGRLLHLGLMSLSALLAVFSREEAYLLAPTSLLIWAILPNYWKFWRRMLLGAVCLLIIAETHFFLRWLFVPEAPAVRFTFYAIRMVWFCARSACFPGGYQTVGFVDDLLAELWLGFVFLLLILFLITGRNRKHWQAGAMVALSVVLCSPALGAAHAYGLTLPTLAFMSAVSLASLEVYKQIAESGSTKKMRQHAVVIFLALGFALGIGSGLRRAMYVAESLHDNCALKILFDSNFIFELYGRPTTVPEQRRAEARSRLAAIGIESVDDVRRVYERCAAYDAEYVQNRTSRRPLFLPKYAFGSY